MDRLLDYYSLCDVYSPSVLSAIKGGTTDNSNIVDDVGRAGLDYSKFENISKAVILENFDVYKRYLLAENEHITIKGTVTGAEDD